MKCFTKPIRRLVTLRSSGPGLPATTWVLEFSETGLSVRKQGSHSTTARRAPWRDLIGVILVHA